MKPLTEAEFKIALTDFMTIGHHYIGFTPGNVAHDEDNSVYAALRDAGLTSVWAAALIHSISQNGIDATHVAVNDNVLLTEMFDFHNTGEGWGFWDAINTLIK